jgi:hypothetical protein
LKQASGVSRKYEVAEFVVEVRPSQKMGCLSMRIPLKAISDSGLIPIAGSEVKPIVFGAKRRWRSYSA